VKVCVTGGTGFLGAHLVRELVEAGHDVRVTYRDAARLSRLGDLPVEPVQADVLDEDALVDAMRGCELLFHSAGYVGARPASRVWSANALAPRLAVQAAGRAGVPRVVHTSSVAAVGPSEPDGVPVREEEPYHSSALHLTYADAKHAGEGEATAAGMRAGVEVVIVNPAYVLGAPVNRGDRGETSTRIIGNYLRGHLPVVMDGGASICDVRDVARGHLLAAELGKPGERYILAGHNIYWYELVDRVRELSGLRQPLAVIPHEAARILRFPEAFGLSGFIVDSEAYGLMGARWWASSEKAVRELGYQFRPVEDTLRETIEWYRELIAAGVFANDARSRLSLMADTFHAGSRLGATRVMRIAERTLGRRLVAGD
jgi:dihydroflavonol-4-reductase